MTRSTPNITILAGITGMNKKQFITNFIEKSDRKDSVLHLDFEEELLNEERDTPLQSLSIPYFLDSPNSRAKLTTLETNFKWLAKKIEDRNNSITDVFLSIHLVYYKNSEFFPPFILNQFSGLTKTATSKFNIITLIDDIFTIWQNLHRRESEFPDTSLRLREISAWRSLEYLYAESLKNHLNAAGEGTQRATNYLVSVRHPFSTFDNLIFKQSSKRIYLSYPISRTRKDPRLVSDINNFRKNMHTTCSHDAVIFDPVTIDELSLTTALNEANDESEPSSILLKKDHRWPLDLDNILTDGPQWPIQIPHGEVNEVKKDIQNQIASRDYILVESSKTLAAYRPYLGGTLSTGVDAEIKHAKEYAKKVVVYNPKEDYGNNNTSPFDSKIASFATPEKFYDHLHA